MNRLQATERRDAMLVAKVDALKPAAMSIALEFTVDGETITAWRVLRAMLPALAATSSVSKEDIVLQLGISVEHAIRTEEQLCEYDRFIAKSLDFWSNQGVLAVAGSALTIPNKWQNVLLTHYKHDL